MSDNPETPRHGRDLAWVRSMGGPLVVIPVSAVHLWGGCTEEGVILGGTDVPDDYDRACSVEEFAGVIGLRDGDKGALVLGDEPATTCYLPDQRIFLRWFAADSDVELFAAAEAVLSDPAAPWEECGTWETDGPAVLMDSAEAGSDLGVPYPTGGGQPDEAPVLIAAGRWRIRAFHKCDEFPWVGVVQLLPEDHGGS